MEIGALYLRAKGLKSSLIHSQFLWPKYQAQLNNTTTVLVARMQLSCAREALVWHTTRCQVVLKHSSMGQTQILQLSRNASTTDLMHVTVI